MSFVIAVIAGIVPMLIYPLFLYWMDRYEKEPLGLLIAAFIWGFIPAAILSLITQILFEIPVFLVNPNTQIAELFGGSIVAPISEEFFKGLAVFSIFLFRRDEFDGVLDGIIYGGLVGFGFAAIENVLYFLEPDAVLIVLRAAVFGLNHALYTSLTGIGFGIARHSQSPLARFIAPIIGLIAAMVLHSVHNTAISFVEQYPGLLCLTLLSNWGGVLFVFLTMIFALRREQQWISTHLKDEVAERVLTEAQYETSQSAVRRLSVQLTAFGHGGFSRWWRVGQFFDTLTELAYKKHAFSRRGESGATQARIEQLRTRAAAMSTELGDVTA